MVLPCIFQFDLPTRGLSIYMWLWPSSCAQDHRLFAIKKDQFWPEWHWPSDHCQMLVIFGFFLGCWHLWELTFQVSLNKVIETYFADLIGQSYVFQLIKWEHVCYNKILFNMPNDYSYQNFCRKPTIWTGHDTFCNTIKILKPNKFTQMSDANVVMLMLLTYLEVF